MADKIETEVKTDTRDPSVNRTMSVLDVIIVAKIFIILMLFISMLFAQQLTYSRICSKIEFTYIRGFQVFKWVVDTLNWRKASK